MQPTKSATELAPVLIDQTGPVAFVWLRRNIETVEEPLEDGGTQTMWVAEETRGLLLGLVTVEEVEEEFDSLWEQFEEEGLSTSESIGRARAIAEHAQAQADFTAIMTDTLIGE